MIPSASLGDNNFGVYEPIHGSAPIIQGKGLANPSGMILSVAMIKHSLNLIEESNDIENAVEEFSVKGFLQLICHLKIVSTDEMGMLFSQK